MWPPICHHSQSVTTRPQHDHRFQWRLSPPVIPLVVRIGDVEKKKEGNDEREQERIHEKRKMLKRGIEPQTFALLARRSNQLSYSSLLRLQMLTTWQLRWNDNMNPFKPTPAVWDSQEQRPPTSPTPFPSNDNGAQCIHLSRFPAHSTRKTVHKRWRMGGIPFPVNETPIAVIIPVTGAWRRWSPKTLLHYSIQSFISSISILIFA